MGGYLLWPADPQGTAEATRRYLQDRYRISYVGALITDSTCSPLRQGTTGICLAHSGSAAFNDHVGEPDLFGRPFNMSQANVAGGLAAAAVVAIGEGAERTPLCLIHDLPLVRFQDRDPTDAELRHGRIGSDEDLFAPFLTSVEWKAGRSSASTGAEHDRPGPLTHIQP